MPKLYDLHLRVPADLLSTLVSLVEGTGIIVSMNDENVQRPRRRRRTPSAMLENRVPGRRVEDVVVASMRSSGSANGEVSLTNLRKQFRIDAPAAGYKSSGLGAGIKRAVRTGWMVRGTRRGMWRLTEAGERAHISVVA